MLSQIKEFTVKHQMDVTQGHSGTILGLLGEIDKESQDLDQQKEKPLLKLI